MYEQDHYFEILRESPQGFAHHEVITDKEGKTVDYVFLEVNEAFERLTGLKAKDIINKKVTEVIPGIEQNEFNWIKFFGNVGLKGAEEEYEQFSAPLNRWYKGYAFSSRKGYFTTMFSDITPDRLISEASRKFMEYAPNTIDYKYITNTMKVISGATFVAMNRFEPDGKDFTTVAIAGHSKSIEDAAKVMGFRLSEKKWKYDPQREARIRNDKTTKFSCLGGLTGNAIPKNIVRLIETTFKTGECAIVKTSKEKTIIGDFTLIYQKGQKVRNQAQLEIYADMVGMLFSRLEAEASIIVHQEELELLSDNIGTQLWYLKNIHTYGAVNKAHTDFMGCQKNDLEHKDLYDMLPKEEADICVQGNKKVFEEKQVVVTDEWIVNGKGEKRLLRITKNPKLDKNDNVVYVVCTAEDITEQWESERKNTAMAERFSMAQAFAGIGGWEYNIDTSELFWTKECEKMFGLEQGGFRGTFEHFMEIVHPDDREYVISMNRPITEGSKGIPLEYEHRIIRPCGSVRWVRESAVVISEKTGEPSRVSGFVMDITERKRVEEALKESEKKIKILLNATPAVVYSYEVDISGTPNLLFINENVTKILGFTPDQFIGQMKFWASCAHPDDIGMVMEKIGTLATKGSIECEYRFKNTAGEWRWLFDRHEVVARSKKGFTVVGVWVDITERKRVEEKILENEKRFNLAISGTGAGLWDWDMVKDTVYYSPYWKKMLGYEDNEVENNFMGWKNLWHPGDAGKIEKAVSDHLAGNTKKYEIEHRLKHKDGSWRWIMTRGDIIKDKNGKSLRWVGTNIDLTENKKLSLEVERQSSLITSLLDSIPDIIFFKDKYGVYLGCNPPFAEFVGRPREEIVGHTDYDLFSKEIADFFRKHDKKMLEQMQPRHNEEWITYPDGRTILIDTLKTPYYGPGGKLIGILGISRDITDRKKAEEAIIRAREQAQAASKAKSEFLANMSHEIRTPLNGVIGFTELLKNTRLTKLQQQYLENANTSAHMLLGIISDILDLSKIESGKFELDPVKTDIIELTAQAIDIVKYKASKKGLEMLLNIQPGMPRFAVVDPIRLKQVLVNLLGNAVKFTEKGEVELRLEFSGISQNRGSFHFSVRDTGIGIEKSKQEKLFDAFFQADTSSTRRFGGTGLGLQISKLLIDKMKGNIGVESEYGKGSTFFFDIETNFEAGEKADKMSVAAIERTMVTDLNNITNPVFLVVEDVFLNMELMKAVLQEILPNAVIHEASNGQQALDLVASEPKIDLVFMDVQMPVMDGLEATRRIRMLEKELDKSIPIIALTAGVVKGEKEKCLEAGMDDFLAKPLNQKLLRKKIQIYLDTESTKAENAEHSPVIIDNHFDIAGVLERSGINQLLVIEIASNSLTSIGNYLPRLKAAIVSSDSDDRELVAHTIKGISLNMGFTTMGILAEKLEMMENDNITSQHELHDAMCKELNLLIELVKQHETPKQSKEPLEN